MKQKHNSDCSGKFIMMKDNININRKSEIPGNFGCPKGFEKSELFFQETYHSQNFRYETLKSPLLKKLSVSLLPHFVWKSQTIKGTFLSFSLIREWMNMNEYMIELWYFWRTSESHYSLSSWYILEIPLVAWGQTLIFMSPLGWLKF